MSETLTWADSIETEKIRTHHAKIVVECTTGKPYYSIEWFDAAKQEYYVGYSSYVIDNVLGWLKEYFEIVEAPKTNADRIRAMRDEELAKLIAENAYTGACNDFGIPHQGQCCHNCERCDAIIKWLKQPVE